MTTKFDDSMDNVKDIMTSAKNGTEHAVERTRSTLLDGLHTVSSVVSILRGFGIGDALGWFGLTRRRSTLAPLVTFGAGMAVGTGLGVLFAPASGAETRRAILNGLRALGGRAEKTGEAVKDAVVDTEKKVENMAGKAKDSVMKAEKRVEDFAGKAKDAVVQAEHSIANAITERTDPTTQTVNHLGDPGNHHSTSSTNR